MNQYSGKILCGMLLLLSAWSVSAAVSSPTDPAKAICTAYSNMQYPMARKLASKYPELPEARLIKALCAVYDRRKQDLSFGLPELGRIYEDKNFRTELRLQAGLAYARAAQTLQMRKGIYPIADGIDYNSVYNKIISDYPASSAACFAITYQSNEWFTSGDEKKVSDAFEKLKNFLNNYKAPQKYLAALNILLADNYIIHGRKYNSAIQYLVAAYEAGISNPRTGEMLLYRIGRMYDIKLHDRKMAEKYYNIFLHKHPHSGYATIIKRYIKEMHKAAGVVKK